jgi:hypothetical protein
VEKAPTGERAKRLGHEGGGKWRRRKLERWQRCWCMLERASGEGTSWREGREVAARLGGQVEKAPAGERAETLQHEGGASGESTSWREGIEVGACWRG